MLVHSVFFWLKSELTEAQRAEFRTAAESLADVASADAVYVGTPSTTDRPVVDRSYDVGLTVILKDVAALDAYQVDPVHKKFLDAYGTWWQRALIYDVD